MRLVFYGTPDDAVRPLRALVDAGHEVALVVTQPDRRRGRGSDPAASPVRRAAEGLGLTVRMPERAHETVEEIRGLHADLGVVVAFGQILPNALLDVVAGGFVNLHFSLLPRWRGAAPVERALLAGDTETGVCLMRVEPELDAGPIYASVEVPISADDTAGTLRRRLVAAGSDLLVRHVARVPGATPTPQLGEPTYAEKLSVEEFRVDPRERASHIGRLIRAGNPKPGAWFVVRGRRVKVWGAHVVVSDDRVDGPPGAVGRHGELVTADGVLALDDVQPEGKRVMPAAAWRAGLRGDVVLDAPHATDDASAPDADDHAT